MLLNCRNVKYGTSLTPPFSPTLFSLRTTPQVFFLIPN